MRVVFNCDYLLGFKQVGVAVSTRSIKIGPCSIFGVNGPVLSADRCVTCVCACCFLLFFVQKKKKKSSQ